MGPRTPVFFKKKSPDECGEIITFKIFDVDVVVRYDEAVGIDCQIRLICRIGWSYDIRAIKKKNSSGNEIERKSPCSYS